MPISKDNTPQNLNLFSHHMTSSARVCKVLCTHMNITKKKKGGLRIETYHFFIDQIIEYKTLQTNPSKPTKAETRKKGASFFF